jgi:predicted RNA binding protein YcfA (HicA-like mRNA interferase family)
MATKGKIRDLMKILRKDGWIKVGQVGSHQQFKHPAKPGRVTLDGKPGDDVGMDNWYSVLRQAGLR